jgi:hypothetical protein
MIRSKGKTAPRVTPQDLADNIVSEHYFTAMDGVHAVTVAAGFEGVDFEPVDQPTETALSLLTFCVLMLRNGFTVVGESACASPENFDAEIGRTIAKANAVQKIWPLMGYALKERLHAQV